MNSAIQQSLLSMVSTNQITPASDQLLGNLENGMNERLSSALFTTINDMKTTSAPEGQSNVVKRTHSKTEILSSALKCDMSTNDSIFMFQKKKKTYMDSCKSSLNGPPTTLVSMAFPESSLQTYDRLRLGKANRRGSLIRESPLPQTDGVLSEHEKLFGSNSSPASAKAASRRSLIAAVLEQATVVGSAVEELMNATYGKPADATFADKGRTAKVNFEEENKLPKTNITPSIRYRAQRRNSFVIHRIRPGSNILKGIPPSCPVLPLPSETEPVPIRPEPQTASSESEIGSSTNENERWSASVSNTNDSTCSGVAELVQLDLSQSVLLSMSEAFQQRSNVPTLTKEAKAYYGYE